MKNIAVRIKDNWLDTHYYTRVFNSYNTYQKTNMLRVLLEEYNYLIEKENKEYECKNIYIILRDDINFAGRKNKNI